VIKIEVKKILAINGVIIFVCLFTLIAANSGWIDEVFKNEGELVAVHYYPQPVIYEAVPYVVNTETVKIREVVKEVPVHTTSTEFERWSRQQALDRANQLIKDVGERK